MRKLTFMRCVIFSAAILLSSMVLAWGQQEKGAPAGIEPLPNQFEQKVNALADRMAAQEKATYEMWAKAIAVAAALGFMATVGSMWQWYSGAKERNRERLASEREQRVTKMLDLYEKIADDLQKRAKELHNVLLNEGRTNVTLVNEMLMMVRDATANALFARERSAQTDIADLKEEVNTLMRFESRDSLDVVVLRDKNDTLKDLFGRLTLLDFTIRNLDRPIELSPACLFLQALKYSQEHRFDAAIKLWRKICGVPGASQGIITCSRYWVGHEQNKLGRFREAEMSFQEAFVSAKGHVSSERTLELERLSIEARLFLLSGEGAEVLIPNINRLVAECENGNLDTVRVMALRTKGNILYTSSLYALNNGDVAKALADMREATEIWKPLAARRISFAEREYAFSCIALQENVDEAMHLLENNVRGEANNLYTNSIRHRDRAYYAMIQLMVASAQRDEDRVLSMDVRANFHVGEMHDLENPYSPLRKRFVSRQEFQRDIRRIIENGLPVLV